MKRIALALTLLAGCGSSSNPGPSTFSAINTQILAGSCALSSSCHQSSMSATANLDLKTDPYNALVNVPATIPKAMQMGLMRVKPGDSANSFMYLKLTIAPSHVAGQAVCSPESDASGNVIPPNKLTDFGSCMPSSSTPLEQSQLDGIKAWIDSGAANN